MIQASTPDSNRAVPLSDEPVVRHGERTPATWQTLLQDAVRDVGELAQLLHLPAESLAARLDSRPSFPLIVPRGFIARMQPGNLNDPLLLQIAPQLLERQRNPLYSTDPVGELKLGQAGVVRKYRGRALLIATGACPVHCRYCFRRHYPYSTQLASRHDWQPALDQLRADKEISEVILSGGDPLSLTNAALHDLLGRCASIDSIDTIRIHTRFPIVIPERIDSGLLTALRRREKKVVIVLHANHANEIDEQVSETLTRLSRSVDLLLNQSVLLKRVNDSAAALSELSSKLFTARVVPYYVHLLDRVQGAAHFEVDEPTAAKLLAEVQALLPGYLVPKLVREVSGALSKVPI